MEIRTFAPDDRDDLLGWTDVTNAVRRVDTPWVPPLTERAAAATLRWGFDLEPAVPLVGTVDGTPVAAGACSLSEHDNTHLAWLSLEVHPDHRRRGLGSLLLGELARTAGDRGRTSLGVTAWESTGAEAFALHHGFVRRAVGVNRRQLLAEVDREALERLHADALARSGDYELVRRLGPTPEDELEALAVMTAAINDAPTDDLDIEDKVYTADRVRDYETAQVEGGMLLHRLLVRHRGTGELAGQTVVAVDLERPGLSDQHDTSVVAAHRGHRLGVLLKTEMLRWLQETRPDLESVDTWNAESNGFMVGVNEQLGYRVMGRAFDLQKDLAVGATAPVGAAQSSATT